LPHSSAKMMVYGNPGSASAPPTVGQRGPAPGVGHGGHGQTMLWISFPTLISCSMPRTSATPPWVSSSPAGSPTFALRCLCFFVALGVSLRVLWQAFMGDAKDPGHSGEALVFQTVLLCIHSAFLCLD
jgi:hypothetical protein